MYIITRGPAEYPIIVDCNELFCQTLGYSRAEILQQPLAKFYTPASQVEMTTGGGSQRARSGQLTAAERGLVARDGRIIETLLRVTPETDAGGQVIGTRSTYTDISELKRAEEALRQSEVRLRSLTEAAFEGIGFAEQGVIIDANDQLAQILGYPRDELLGRPVLDFVAPESAAAVRATIEGGGQGLYEHLFMRKDGTKFPVEVRTRLMAAGERTIRVSAIRDITERKRAEAEQAKLEQQLRQAQKMESVGRLAGGVAHDFNNLLTVIRGYSDLMQSQIPGGSPLLKDLEQIQRASKRAAALTRQLLAFSRQQILAPTILNLNSLVTDLHKMLERLIGEDIILSMVLQPGLRSGLFSSIGYRHN
jgi:PAS domain S-box-containing protein